MLTISAYLPSLATVFIGIFSTLNQGSIRSSLAGGPVGLRLAIELKLGGHQVTVFEKRREHRNAQGEQFRSQTVGFHGFPMKNYIPIKKQLPWRKILGETWRNHHLFFWRNMRIEIGTVGSGDLRDIFQNHGWYGWSIFS